MQERVLTPKKSSYVNLIYAHGQSGNPRMALKLLEEMIQKGFPPPAIYVYEKVVGGIWEDGEIQEAHNIDIQILNKGLVLQKKYLCHTN